MNLQVIFNPEARDDLYSLYQYIAEHGFPDRAASYIHRIENFCLALQTFPQRGASWDHVRPGLRVVPFERRVSIVFQVTTSKLVIYRILAGGRDLESLIAADE